MGTGIRLAKINFMNDAAHKKHNDNEAEDSTFKIDMRNTFQIELRTPVLCFT